MKIDQTPWLFLKRMNHWNPLSNVDELASPPARAAQPSTVLQLKAKKLRARWSFLGPIP